MKMELAFVSEEVTKHRGCYAERSATTAVGWWMRLS
jgi:hypothetical protein